ncbi:zf-TFIIB domain-containing protein [Chitinivorax sp. B]|uniref:zf-TFIIB domain-containing protein n=1 Tax=Chitinivorax sp. B TaxID=2502235 RepID=UPI0010F78118|nr:zf-TFIIB domain-containing protein [Chitinivorax sp. B]
MHCPTCNEALSQYEPAAGLRAHHCEHGHGMWLDIAEYRRWLPTQAAHGASPLTEPISDISDHRAARACPVCTRIMQKYRVSSRFDYRLDRCNTCQGVWFDQGEWDALVALQQQGDLNTILSDAGQRDIQATISRERIDARDRERFGDTVFAELQRIRQWLANQPNAHELLAYLNRREH